MGWDDAPKKFARLLAFVGLAAAITIGLSGTATAAPADRGGDAVVLKGGDAAGMLGAEPGKIVAFRWNGQWSQIPVQIDERHTINVRQLYPDEPLTGYIGPTTLGFTIEAYADPKTRSGADADPTFDADDELAFMGGDAGSDAPADVAPPAGVDGQSGVKVAVGDPVGGGGASVYLFKATSGMEQSAGKDYVKYDFKLTGLGAGETLLEDYGYIHSSNPEDSKVTTDNYELHSFDRWMEDEIKVKAGDSTGADILDREVAQAFLTQCGRTEYTFSGRWTEDSWAGNDGATDDEGTYVAVIDGPVRAIRSYMGANSGPYVQREHIYYADHEKNTIFLRVHTMGDLYSWTDYASGASGMTYRDEMNPSGVTIDGNPDVLTPTTTDKVANGAFSWQQVSGPQGTLSTVVSAVTDIPGASFGNYYLDDSTPAGGNEVQCGGDGQSIGASGFGILGPITPNTDPRLGTFNNLTVQRTRYFGPPDDGVAQAAAYRDRVAKPLTATASTNPVTGGPVKGLPGRLKIDFPGRKPKAAKGKNYRLKVKISNTGTAEIGNTKICVRGAALKRKVVCRNIGTVSASKPRTLVFKLKVKPKARGKKLKLRVTASSKPTGSVTSRRLVVGFRR